MQSQDPTKTFDLNLNDITIGRKIDIEILGYRIKYRNEKVQIVGKIL